jgi:hypothetical protein
VSVEALAIIGAITGVVGALTGVASLGWQVVTHRSSGRLVNVNCAYTMPAVIGADGKPIFADDQVSIIVTNAGGAPVTITNYGVSIDGKKSGENLFVLAPTTFATRVPFVLEPGGTPAELMVGVDYLRQVHQERGIPFDRMRPWVALGDGRRIYSKRPVPLK